MMSFTRVDNANGTYSVGSVSATRRDIESVFGAPDEFGEGDKVTTEWDVTWSDGTVSTIYDWKRYESGAPGMDEWYEWHVGGHGGDSLHHVVTALYPHHANRAS